MASEDEQIQRRVDHHKAINHYRYLHIAFSVNLLINQSVNCQNIGKNGNNTFQEL